MRDIKLAILDFYDGIPNQGMRCIMEIVKRFERRLDSEWFDVRGKSHVPNVEEYDIYICSGGPGDPRDGDGIWDKKFYDLLDAIWANNQQEDSRKKYVFFICHSFQMATNHFNLGKISARKSKSFGTFPVHMTDAGKADPYFAGLSDAFTVGDFRSYQVLQPNTEKFVEMGAEVLALEKERPHVELERAIMAIRFSPEIFGVQFHPEADAAGLLSHFRSEEMMVHVLTEYSKDKYEQMIRDLTHPEKIELTHQTVLPTFINDSILALKEALVPVES